VIAQLDGAFNAAVNHEVGGRRHVAFHGDRFADPGCFAPFFHDFSPP
jgi:hypothetical protein